MSELETHAAEIVEQFSDQLELSQGDVEERLETLVGEYRVPLEEARRSVVSHYLEQAGMERDELSSGDSELTVVGEIDQDEQWVDLRVKVADLWEPGHDSIAQVGLLGDESGTMKFVAFDTSDLPELEEDTSYSLSNVVTDEYEGSFSVKLNKTTGITELDEEIEVGDDATTISGALVDIQSGSGLIKRCPEDDCTRVLQNGRCSEHGQVEGEFDLRIKAVLDDGTDVHEVIFNKEMTEELTGIEIDAAKQMAKDALDTTVVVEEMEGDLMGQYFEVTGPTFGRYVLVDEFERLTEPADPEAVLIKARSI